MNRIIVIILGVACVVLTILSCVSTQAPTTKAPKAGKPLVKRLPAHVEGVELVGGMVRVKPGFQWVKQPNGTVTVARIGGGGGGPGISGSWSCDCTGANATGTCSSTTSQGSLSCYKSSKDTCTGTCELTVTTRGVTTGIFMY
jgi:hypothetical protein